MSSSEQIPSGQPVMCSSPQCPLRDGLQEERMRCSRLAAANQVLRDAQQFLLAKCEAAAEHSNMLSLELESARNEREVLRTEIRAERMHFNEQREDLRKRWQHLESVEAALTSTKRQLLSSQQENHILREQVASLQDSINRLTERLAAQRGRGRTPEKHPVVATTDVRRAEGSERSISTETGSRNATPTRRGGGGEANAPEGRRSFGTLVVDPQEKFPANFYHSPQKSITVRTAALTRDQNRPAPSEFRDLPELHSESEQRSQFDSFKEFALTAPPPPPPPLESASHKVHSMRTPNKNEQDAFWIQPAVGAASLPSSLSDYTRAMQEALQFADSVIAGIPSASSEVAANQRRAVAAGTSATSANQVAPTTSFSSSSSSTLPTSIEERQGTQPSVYSTRPIQPKKFDVVDTGISAAIALKMFREATHASDQPSSSPPPPPPPPPEDDDVSPSPPRYEESPPSTYTTTTTTAAPPGLPASLPAAPVAFDKVERRQSPSRARPRDVFGSIGSSRRPTESWKDITSRPSNRNVTAAAFDEQ